MMRSIVEGNFVIGRDNSPYVFWSDIDIEDCVQELGRNAQVSIIPAILADGYAVMSHYSPLWTTKDQLESGFEVDITSKEFMRAVGFVFFTEGEELQDVFIRAGLATSRRDYRTLQNNLEAEEWADNVLFLSRKKKKHLMAGRFAIKLTPTERTIS